MIRPVGSDAGQLGNRPGGSCDIVESHWPEFFPGWPESKMLTFACNARQQTEIPSEVHTILTPYRNALDRAKSKC